MNIDVDMQKIRCAVNRALALMDEGFDVRALARNDPDHDWEFKAVERLQDRYGVLAFYHAEPPLVTVLWDSALDANDVQVSIAHELGHHFLHALTGQAKAYSQGEHDRMELEAEVFSRELLAGIGSDL